MSLRTKGTEDDTPLSPAELQAVHRLAEPRAARAEAQPDQLWASRYRIVAKIGKGGMGDVYLAHDIVLDRQVALKVLRKTSDESFVDETRLLREARAAAKVEHERLARVYDALTWNDQALIAMEYVRGESLRDWMKRYRPTMTEVVTILQQVLEGLQVLHDNGLVHRDLKPENIMVTMNGNLRILDLGIARRVALADTTLGKNEAPGLFTLGFGVGTPGYMAPEQWRHGNIEVQADLFALGVIAYELVVGRQPFCGSTNLEIREATLHAPLSLTSPEWKDVPPAVKNTVQTALEREPSKRFQNVGEMAKALKPLFRPTLPPISGPRSHPIRPPGEEKNPIESMSASVVGMSRGIALRRSPVALIAGGLIFATAMGWGVVKARSQRVRWEPTRGMVRFAGGSLTMGSERTELNAMCASYPRGCPKEAEYETPPRRVTVAPFELDEREVTNEEFAAFLTNIGASIHVRRDDDEPYPRFVYYTLRPKEELLLYDLWKPGSGIDLTPPSDFAPRPQLERHPVTLVTWLGARLYCKSVGKRLPTEAEWELAARGLSDNRLYPWGNHLPDCGALHLWTGGSLNVHNPELCDAFQRGTTPVMSSSQDVTPQRVFDLGGSVTEWVEENELVNDDEATYVARITAERAAIHRGGAYNAAFMMRSTSRSYRLAFNVAFNLGFRCTKPVVSSL
jgi:formylglycine-generating enzyme required for sulfatase activity/tRNA A-37 threonylcarbamoyl transferase component Bud32